MTITLPGHMADRVRKQAKQKRQPISRFIAEAIEERERGRIDKLMEQGYRECAALNKQLAEEALPAIREVLPPDETW